MPTTPMPTTSPTPTDAEAPAPRRFRLMRYFTLATLVAFIAVGATLLVLQKGEEEFFDRSQREQLALVAQAQAQLERQEEAAARASLLAVHETSHVTLTGVVANLLWASDIAPFVAAAQPLPVEPCRALPRGEPDSAQARARRACFAELGRRIQALPGYKALDAKAYAAMRGTNVFKIKVWDLRGVAVYSSEAAQIGDDGAGNKGWQAAIAGRPASELTHRDRFSAFEGVVENRDLISTYVPVRDDPAGPVVGVFELYSDVTPFLAQAREASRHFTEIARTQEEQLLKASMANRQSVYDSSNRFLLLVGGLLALLYAASLVIVHFGQRIIDRQTLAQEQALRREQLWHSEKMAALAAMADNVSHEVGNPLAVISGLAEQMGDAGAPPTGPVPPPSRQILEQTDRIARMMRQISAFASARAGAAEWVDVNAMAKAVCDLLGYDRRFKGLAIDFQPGEHVPARELVPDHLNEVLMNLLQTAAQRWAARSPAPRARVSTSVRGDDLVVRMAAEPPAGTPAGPWREDAGLAQARRRIHDMGARLLLADDAVELVLPAPWGQERAGAASARGPLR